MEKTRSQQMINLIDSLLNKDPHFSLQKIEANEFQKLPTHILNKINMGYPFHGTYYVKNKYFISFLVWNQKRNPGVYYILISHKNTRVAEIHIIKNGQFEWQYSPRKHDDFNKERQNYFRTKNGGSISKNIDIPNTVQETFNFLEELCLLADLRLEADDGV